MFLTKNKINSDIKLETLNLSKETENFLLNLKIHTSPSKVKKTKEKLWSHRLSVK